MSFTFKSDCCKYKTTIRWKHRYCLKCNKKCVFERLSTDDTRGKKLTETKNYETIKEAQLYGHK